MRDLGKPPGEFAGAELKEVQIEETHDKKIVESNSRPNFSFKQQNRRKPWNAGFGDTGDARWCGRWHGAPLKCLDRPNDSKWRVTLDTQETLSSASHSNLVLFDD